MVKKQTIIITGCSSGIGYSLAIELATSKTNLVLASRNIDFLNELGEKCKEKGAEILILKTDVSVESDCKNLVSETLKKFNSIDILINNAGVSMYVNFEDVKKLELFKRIIEINYLGMVYCTHYALQSIKKQKGLIVGISSLQGKTGFPRSTGYSASKFAMQGFLDSLRIELYGSGVDILVVSPGAINTDIHNKQLNENGEISKGRKDYRNVKMMSIQQCVKLIKKAIENRNRELVMTFKGKLIPWLKPLFPKLLDKTVLKLVNKFHK